MSEDNQMPQLPGIVGWVLTACVSIGILLSGIIRWMYAKIEAMYATQLSEQGKQLLEVKEECKVLKQQNKECLADREGLRIQCAEHRARIELLEKHVHACEEEFAEKRRQAKEL